MVQHQDVKYWKEPVYDNARDHDVRILVENALGVSDARKAMTQAADNQNQWITLLIVSLE